MKKPAIETVEAEIRKERAEALGRAGERLEQALGVLHALQQEIERVGTGLPGGSRHTESTRRAGDAAIFTRYRALLARARELRYFLIIQREAIGLCRHDDVDRQYPMPPEYPLGAGRRGRERR